MSCFLHWYYDISVFSVINLCIVCFTCAISKWGTIFKYYVFIFIIWSISWLCCDWYSSFSKNVCITVIAKLNFNIEVLNLIWSLLYVPDVSSFISTQLVDLIYCLTNLLFCDIPLLYYYINRKLSIIFCHSYIYIYIYI